MPQAGSIHRSLKDRNLLNEKPTPLGTKPGWSQFNNTLQVMFTCYSTTAFMLTLQYFMCVSVICGEKFVLEPNSYQFFLSHSWCRRRSSTWAVRSKRICPNSFSAPLDHDQPDQKYGLRLKGWAVLKDVYNFWYCLQWGRLFYLYKPVVYLCIIFESMHSIFALPGWRHECILKKRGLVI